MSAFAKEDAPFFGTFVEHRLGPLDLQACRDMLVALARQAGDDETAADLETPAGLARVGALRHVLGGQPRAMALIYPHLAETEASSLVEAVERLSEDLTPYFQEQLARLSAGQRPVMEILADSWRPLSVGEISERTLTPPTTTSTHLRRLRGDALVVATRLGREVFYEVADPLFRISRAMKTAPARVEALLRLMQTWFEWTASGRWRIDEDATVERWFARTGATRGNVQLGFFWWLASGRSLEPIAQAVGEGWIELEGFDADHLCDADWKAVVTRLAEPEREAVRAIVHHATPEARQQEFDEAFPQRER